MDSNIQINECGYEWLEIVIETKRPVLFDITLRGIVTDYWINKKAKQCVKLQVETGEFEFTEIIVILKPTDRKFNQLEEVTFKGILNRLNDTLFLLYATAQ